MASAVEEAKRKAAEAAVEVRPDGVEAVLVIFMTGVPGSGKGWSAAEAARRLASRGLSLGVYSAGQLLRDEAARDPEGALAAVVRTGAFVESVVTTSLVLAAVQRTVPPWSPGAKFGVALLDGFPRLAANWADWRELAPSRVYAASVVGMAEPDLELCARRCIARARGPEDTAAVIGSRLSPERVARERSMFLLAMTGCARGGVPAYSSEEAADHIVCEAVGVAEEWGAGRPPQGPLPYQRAREELLLRMLLRAEEPPVPLCQVQKSRTQSPKRLAEEALTGEEPDEGGAKRSAPMP